MVIEPPGPFGGPCDPNMAASGGSCEGFFSSFVLLEIVCSHVCKLFGTWQCEICKLHFYVFLCRCNTVCGLCIVSLLAAVCRYVSSRFLVMLVWLLSSLSLSLFTHSWAPPYCICIDIHLQFNCIKNTYYLHYLKCAIFIFVFCNFINIMHYTYLRLCKS